MLLELLWKYPVTLKTKLAYKLDNFPIRIGFHKVFWPNFDLDWFSVCLVGSKQVSKLKPVVLVETANTDFVRCHVKVY